MLTYHTYLLTYHTYLPYLTGAISYFWSQVETLEKRLTGRQAGRQAGKQLGRQAGRQASGQAGRRRTADGDRLSSLVSQNSVMLTYHTYLLTILTYVTLQVQFPIFGPK